MSLYKCLEKCTFSCRFVFLGEPYMKALKTPLTFSFWAPFPCLFIQYVHRFMYWIMVGNFNYFNKILLNSKDSKKWYVEISNNGDLRFFCCKKYCSFDYLLSDNSFPRSSGHNICLWNSGVVSSTGAPPLTRFSYNTVLYLTWAFFNAWFSHLVLNQSSFSTVFPIT